MRTKENIHWEWYFQPLDDSLRSKRNVTFVECKRKRTHICLSLMIFLTRKRFTSGVSGIKIYSLKFKTREYIEAEYKQLFEGKRKVLGVICRGTDYLALKPSGHPVQPEIKDVIAYCKKYMEKNKYDAIYLATEERKTRDL